MDTTKAMGSEPIGKLLFQFALPTTASMLVSALYSLVDRIFIGQGVGVSGIAAATAAFPFMIVGMATGLLFAVGARSLASIALGAGRPEEAQEAISRATGLAFLGTSLAGILIWIFAWPLLSLFGAGAGIMAEAHAFLGWTLLGLPFMSATMAVATSLQVQGRPRASFVLNLVGSLINVLLEPLFIFVFHWGLAGAAAATALAQVLSCLLALAVVQSRKSSLRLLVRQLVPNLSWLGRLGAIGAPIFLVNLVSTAVLVVANRAIAPWGGDLALAVIGVVNTVGMVVSYPLYGITNGAQALIGYNYGARKWGRLERLCLLVGAWTLGLAALAQGLAMVFPHALIGVFSSDPQLVAMGSRALRLFMLAFALFPLSQLPAIYYQSTGRPLAAGILMLGRSLAMILGMLILPRWFGLDGVYYAGPLADGLSAAIGAVLLFRMVRELKAAREGEGFRSTQALSAMST